MKKTLKKRKKVNWIRQLGEIWPTWDREMELARRSGATELPTLTFPEGARRDEMIRDSTQWACMHRGLGDYARFALMRYLKLKDGGECIDQFANLPVEKWDLYFRQALTGETTLFPATWLERFDEQLRGDFVGDADATLKRVQRFKPTFDYEDLWPTLARAADQYLADQGRARPPLDPETLRWRRFAGVTAIVDFVRYINFGEVPERQAAFADEIGHLGMLVQSRFVSSLRYFPSKARRSVLEEIVADLAQPWNAPALPAAGVEPKAPPAGVRISCLWSALQPHGLIAACQRMVVRYRRLCNTRDLRRLEMIYVPVGLDARRQYVSRLGAVRDLHNKLRIRRARARREQSVPLTLSTHPSGEEVAAAIQEIREELAREPALLVFGIHQVSTDRLLEALEDEILDAPLPFLISRLVVPIVGELSQIGSPDNTYATRILILADGKLENIAHIQVFQRELPSCSPTQFAALLETARTQRARAFWLAKANSSHPLPAITSNEIELTIFDAALAFDANGSDGEQPHILRTQAVSRIWGHYAHAEDAKRVVALVEIIVEHIVSRAATHQDAAWFATLLHIVSLVPGGIRKLTAARVLAGYVMATSSIEPSKRPPWGQDAEASLWTFKSKSISDSELNTIEWKIVKEIARFRGRASGLVRLFPSAVAPGFDDYPHPFDSPAVQIQFDFVGATKQLEFISPLVRQLICDSMQRRQPKKHAMLSRLMAEEFLRRLAVIQSHRAAIDFRSLVDKRYAILAIYLGLQSLRFNVHTLTSEDAKIRWLIPTQSPLGTFQWLYRWLYVGQLNEYRQALSQQQGAERLKRAVLDAFWRSYPRGLSHPLSPKTTSSRHDLRAYRLKSSILQSLLHVSIRTSDKKLAELTLSQLEALSEAADEALRTIGHPARPQDISRFHQLTSEWIKSIEGIRRENFKLALDAAVSYGAAYAPAGIVSGLHPSRMFRAALKALFGPLGTGLVERANLLSIIARTLRSHRRLDPESWRFDLAVRSMRKNLLEGRLQYFYDYLMRYAELVAGTAELRPNKQRSARRHRAMMLFEMAEALRQQCTTESAEEVLRLGARPVRNAARICLALGKHTGRNWYFERAQHYCFHVVGNHSQQSVERIAVLIIQALAVRLRGTTQQLQIAMSYLNAAEKALINYPDRIQLRMRFHLERAKLFRALAKDQQSSSEQKHRWIFYCHADVAAVHRLAEKRLRWADRASRVLIDLPVMAPYHP